MALGVVGEHSKHNGINDADDTHPFPNLTCSQEIHPVVHRRDLGRVHNPGSKTRRIMMYIILHQLSHISPRVNDPWNNTSLVLQDRAVTCRESGSSHIAWWIFAWRCGCLLASVAFTIKTAIVTFFATKPLCRLLLLWIRSRLVACVFRRFIAVRLL